MAIWRGAAVCAQAAHVGRNTRHTQQATLLVEQVLQAVVVPALLQQVQQHAGVQRCRCACPSSNRPALKNPWWWRSSGPHVAAHRLAPLPRCAISTRPLARALRSSSDAHDVLVGQAMKTVAAHTLLVQRLWQGKSGSPLRAAWRERRCQNRPPAANPERPGRKARTPSRLCGWCSGASEFSRVSSASTAVGDDHAGTEHLTAMHHPVRHRLHGVARPASWPATRAGSAAPGQRTCSPRQRQGLLLRLGP